MNDSNTLDVNDNDTDDISDDLSIIGLSCLFGDMADIVYDRQESEDTPFTVTVEDVDGDVTDVDIEGDVNHQRTKSIFGLTNFMREKIFGTRKISVFNF